MRILPLVCSLSAPWQSTGLLKQLGELKKIVQVRRLAGLAGVCKDLMRCATGQWAIDPLCPNAYRSRGEAARTG